MIFQTGGSEFALNTTKAGVQRYGDIAALEGGGFVSVWADGGNVVRAQRLSATGAKTGTEFVVNTPDDAIIQGRPAVTGLDNGGFAVVWYNYLTGIVAQRYDASGRKVGDDILVNGTAQVYQSAPSVSAVSGGRFAVSWESKKASDGPSNIVSQLIGDTGKTVGGLQSVTSLGGWGAFGPATAGLESGYVVAWQDASGAKSVIRAQIFTDGGAKKGAVLTVATADGFVRDASIAALKDGGFAVAWTESGASGSYGVAAQRFADGGKAVGAKVAVADASSQFVSQPDVTALPDGGFAVSWQAQNTVTYDTDVFARAFTTAGTATSAAFKVNTASAGNQDSAEIAAGKDGKLGVIWTDQTGSEVDLSGRVLNSDFKPSKLTLTGDFKADVAFKGAVKLTAADLGVADAEGKVVYKVSSLKGGEIGLLNAATTTTTFTQADLAAGKVFFIQKGTAEKASFKVSASDGGEATAAKTFNLVVTNDAPKNIRLAGGDSENAAGTALVYAEETADAWRLRVTDEEEEVAPDIKWSIVGGADKKAFMLEGEGDHFANLRLKERADYEKPTDGNKDHKFEVVVRATDSLGEYTDQALTVRVQDLKEFTIKENAANGTVIVKGAGAAKAGASAAMAAKAVKPPTDWGIKFSDLADLFKPIPPGTDLEELAAELDKQLVEAIMSRFAEIVGTAGIEQFFQQAAIKVEKGNVVVKNGLLFDYEQNSGMAFEVGFDRAGKRDFSKAYLVKLADVKDEYVLGDGYDNTIHGGSGRDIFFGYGGKDTLIGGDGTNVLDGGEGDDAMLGGAHDDTYGVDSLKDRVSEIMGGGKDDTIRSSISYSLLEQEAKGMVVGSIENLTLLEDKDATRATGNELDNAITGNSFNNVIDGYKGADVMQGLGGSDTYYVDNGKDLVDESAKGSGGEADGVISTVSFDLTNRAQARGDIENVILAGKATDAAGKPIVKGLSATGNALANKLYGDGGNNALTGGAGADTLHGGTADAKDKDGADTFRFLFVSDSGTTKATRDTIMDFGPGDHIDLSAINPTSGEFRLDKGGAFTTGEIRQTYDSKAHTVLLEISVDAKAGADMSIMLMDMNGALKASDFIV